MTRRLTLLLILSALFVMLAMPVVAQDEATAEPAASAAAESPAPEATEEPTLPPLPTAIPSSDGSVVQALLFFSQTCGHCHSVITETFPPLFQEHGGEAVVTIDESIDTETEAVAFYLMSNGQLQVLLVDVGTADGQAMFSADAVRLETDSGGVPRLDVSDGYLVGSAEIPAVFPGIVADGLAGEGVPWPEVPGLEAALAPFIAQGAVLDPDATPEPTVEPTAEPTDAVEPSEAPADATAAPDATVAPSPDPDDGGIAIPIGEEEGLLDRIGRDPVGNGVSIIVLIVLIASLIAVPVLALRGSLPSAPGWLVIVLVAIGIVVAAYLASIETSGSEAVCGPVGDCNAVQESEYAKLFGIPIGVLGVIGYLLIGGLWLVTRFSEGTVADWAAVFIALGAFGGTLFSTYLTFLEPFVIGATCMWCITSAVVMVALLWITAGPGWAAFGRLRGGSPSEPASA